MNKSIGWKTLRLITQEIILIMLLTCHIVLCNFCLIFNSLLEKLQIDPLGQPKVRAGRDNCFRIRLSVRPSPLFKSRKTKQQKTMFATGCGYGCGRVDHWWRWHQSCNSLSLSEAVYPKWATYIRFGQFINVKSLKTIYNGLGTFFSLPENGAQKTAGKKIEYKRTLEHIWRI